MFELVMIYIIVNGVQIRPFVCLELMIVNKKCSVFIQKKTNKLTQIKLKTKPERYYFRELNEKEQYSLVSEVKKL
jgi:hypothetical protein